MKTMVLLSHYLVLLILVAGGCSDRKAAGPADPGTVAHSQDTPPNDLNTNADGIPTVDAPVPIEQTTETTEAKEPAQVSTTPKATPDDQSVNRTTSEVDQSDPYKAPHAAKTIALSRYRFETPQRLKAGGEWISVEAPGYACPTMADVDGDGVDDLVVGQYNDGNMLFCRNVADQNATPSFAEAEWLSDGKTRIVVPGVW